MRMRSPLNHDLITGLPNPMQVIVVANCVSCAREGRLPVDIGAYSAWRQGVYAQQAFPFTTPGEREWFFISGMCPTCWDAMFTPTDDDRLTLRQEV